MYFSYDILKAKSPSGLLSGLGFLRACHFRAYFRAFGFGPRPESSPTFNPSSAIELNSPRERGGEGGLKNLLRGREGAAGFFFACYHPPSSASPPASSPFSARRGCEERRTEEGGGPPSSILLWRERSAISSQTSSSPFLSSLFHPLVVGCLLLQWGSALLMALLFFWGRSKGTALGLGTDGARLPRPLSTSELREQLLRWSKHAGSRRPKYIPHTHKEAASTRDVRRMRDFCKGRKSRRLPKENELL